MENSSNKKINSRFSIEINDERPHKNKTHVMREWWYYNAYFNHPQSDLKNWSILLSISPFYNSGSAVKIMLLYDDKNNNYGGKYRASVEKYQKKEASLNVVSGKSYIEGMYPKWNLHFENVGMDGKEIVAELEYIATKKPTWILKNTGHNTSTSKIGYYFVMNCKVEGSIKIDDKKYNVKGVGYHDHTWMPLFKKKEKTSDEMSEKKEKKLNSGGPVWDWIYFHFDNDWNIFLAKIYISKRSPISVFLPGSLNFVSEGNSLMESYFFPVIYKNYQETSVPNLKIPNEIGIRSMKINPLNKHPIKGPLYLDITYKTDNIKESLYGNPPKWGMWYSSGKVAGKLKGIGKEIDLNGFGIFEHTRNI